MLSGERVLNGRRTPAEGVQHVAAVVRGGTGHRAATSMRLGLRHCVGWLPGVGNARVLVPASHLGLQTAMDQPPDARKQAVKRPINSVG